MNIRPARAIGFAPIVALSLCLIPAACFDGGASRTVGRTDPPLIASSRTPPANEEAPGFAEAPTDELLAHGSSPAPDGPAAHALVNAPVAPEAIYVGTAGDGPGVRVLDLNGYGQGTGDLATTNFGNNPNVGAPGVTPALAPGTSSVDAGGAGFLTWTQDAAGSQRLGASTGLQKVRTLVLGQPLDLVWNNERRNPFTQGALHANPTTFQPMVGNCIESAPHPNPPRILSPTPDPLTGVETEEPTVTSSSGPAGELTTSAPPCLPSPPNALVPGGNPGLFGSNHPGVFVGPQPAPGSPPPPIPYCPFAMRQQIGHFLYALDAAAGTVQVLNSNRMTELAQLSVPGACAMAISPDLRLLAVTSVTTNDVTFIDSDPLSPTFHQVVAMTPVGRRPCALAWQPEGEALLVCNGRSGSLSILDGTTLQVVRTVRRFVFGPTGIAVSARQDALGLGTGSYYAFVQNRFGIVTVFESGPVGSGARGRMRVPFPLVVLGSASSLQIDMSSLEPAVWVGHRDSGGLGVVSRYELVQRRFGLQMSRTQSVGGFDPSRPSSTLLSGNHVVDIAFDDVHNHGALADRRLQTLPPSTLQHSNKGIAKVDGAQFVPAHAPRLVFIALGDTGKIDVFDLSTHAKLSTLDAPGVTCLGNYFHQ